MEKPNKYFQITENVGTSVQPTREQFSGIAAEGYDVVNLAMHNSDNAIPEEGSIVTGLERLIFICRYRLIIQLWRWIMNEENFNISMRKFLKKVGVTSQREIEKAVSRSIDSGKIQGNELLGTRVVLEIKDLDLRTEIDGNITLE
jgi:hypothetical protein